MAQGDSGVKFKNPFRKRSKADIPVADMPVIVHFIECGHSDCLTESEAKKIEVTFDYFAPGKCVSCRLQDRYRDAEADAWLKEILE
jgi:hypothetical protein